MRWRQGNGSRYKFDRQKGSVFDDAWLGRKQGNRILRRSRFKTGTVMVLLVGMHWTVGARFIARVMHGTHVFRAALQNRSAAGNGEPHSAGGKNKSDHRGCKSPNHAESIINKNQRIKITHVSYVGRDEASRAMAFFRCCCGSIALPKVPNADASSAYALRCCFAAERARTLQTLRDDFRT